MSESKTKLDESSAASVANVSTKETQTDDVRELDNKPERLEWLQDAGFGMFIHWSMDSQLGCVISHTLVGASEDYQNRFYNELPKTFNPKRYDPEEIAVLAKLAGVKYIVFTTKHHSGFCMWDTKTTDFNIMNTRYGKDIVAQYVEAVRREELAVGFYYSPEDWSFLYKNGITIRRVIKNSDGETVGFSNSLEGEVREKYRELIRLQCTELMTNYGQVDLIFFDGGMADIAKETCWKLQPDILVTRGAINTPEQTVPGIPPEGAWESNLTMGTQWHYKPTNEEYKSGTRLLEILIEARAKGGSLLLNVGPKPDGTLPEQQEARLREIALWHFVNGEAIYNTRPWIVTNEGNIWFTKKKDENTIYAFVTGMPNWSRGDRKEFVLGSVEATDETQVSVLGQSSELVEYAPDKDASCRWNQEEDGLHLSIVRAQRLYNNSKWPNPVVVKITNVKPALKLPLIRSLKADVQNDGTVKLSGNLVSMGDADEVTVGFEYRKYGGFVEELYDDTWTETEFIKVNDTGQYQTEVKGLTNDVYQFRAVVKHPRITMYGDKVRFSV